MAWLRLQCCVASKQVRDTHNLQQPIRFTIYKLICCLGEEIHKSLSDDKIKFTVMPAFAELHYGDLVNKLLTDVNGIVVDLK